MAFTLAPLPYAYEALEPHIDTETMLSTCYCFVYIVHISLVVLIVVYVHGFNINMWLQSFVYIRERCQCKCHCINFYLFKNSCSAKLMVKLFYCCIVKLLFRFSYLELSSFLGSMFFTFFVIFFLSIIFHRNIFTTDKKYTN